MSAHFGLPTSPRKPWQPRLDVDPVDFVDVSGANQLRPRRGGGRSLGGSISCVTVLFAVRRLCRRRSHPLPRQRLRNRFGRDPGEGNGHSRSGRCIFCADLSRQLWRGICAGKRRLRLLFGPRHGRRHVSLRWQARSALRDRRAGAARPLSQGSCVHARRSLRQHGQSRRLAAIRAGLVPASRRR